MSEQRAADTNGSVTIEGRYRVIGPGVQSDDAITYVAEDAVTRRAVTLVVLRGEAAADAEFVTAVREQAYRLAKPACHHRALVRVYETGTTDEGAPFVALEALSGRSLRAVLAERGPFGIHDGLRLAIEIGEGLETLHHSGIVHGELRPESVLLVTDEHGRDVVKLVGVELTAARRTLAGLRIRNDAALAYLAPEQIARAETTDAADIHALGLLILELVTGHRPDGAGSRAAKELPPPIARIVARALEEGPGRRYSSISLMVNDMWNVESEQPSQSPARASRPPTYAAAAHRPVAPRRARADVGVATALVVGLVLVGVTAWTVRSDRLSRRVSPEPEPVVAASPLTPTPVAPPPTIAPAPPPVTPPVTTAAKPARSETAPTRKPTLASPPAKPVAVGAVVGPPRSVARSVGRPASADQPSADDADSTAIIDWLLKGRRSSD